MVFPTVLSKKEKTNLLVSYMGQRRISSLDLAMEALCLERFFIEKPGFVEGVEYYALFKPTDSSFNSLYVGGNCYCMTFASSVMQVLSGVVKEAYGLEPGEPIYRNSNQTFQNIGLAMLANMTGVESNSEEAQKYIDLVRRELGDDLEAVFPGSLQAVLANLEKMAPEEVKILGDNAPSVQFMLAAISGFDCIDYYNPFFRHENSSCEGEKAKHLKFINSLKENGLYIVQYDTSSYPYFPEIKSRLAEIGINPALETDRFDKPFSPCPEYIAVYKKPAGELTFE